MNKLLVIALLLWSSVTAFAGGGGGGGGCGGGTSMSCGVSYSDNTSSGGCVGCDPTNNNNSIGLCCYAGADYDCNGTEDVTFSVENTQMFTYTFPAGVACPTTITFTISTTGNLQGACFNTSDLGVGGGYDGGASTSDEHGSSVMGSGAFTLTSSGCAGETIQIMVDGYAGAGAAFTISVPCPPIVLAVELVELKGVSVGNANKITWITMAEVANDYFLIERSSTGKDDDYEVIGSVKGAGNRTARMEYEFLDEQSPPDIGYYRVTAVDYDGQRTPSDTIVVRKNELINLVVSPNPVEDYFWVEAGTDRDVPVFLTLLDPVGRVVHASVHDAASGKFKAPINMQQLPRGVYYLDVYNGFKHEVVKIVKQ